MYRLAVGLFFILTLLSCTFTTQPAKSELVVCINFDDNSSSVMENALPIMQEYGFRASMFVNSGRVGNQTRLTWQQLQELKNIYGWEIGGHTINHVNLATQTPEEAEYSIKADYDSLKAYGFHPTSFATPFGYCPISYYPIILRYYRNIRTCFDTAMLAPVDRTMVGSMSVINTMNPRIVANRIKQAVIERENLVVLLFHEVTDGTASYASTYTTQDFAEVMRLIHKMGVTVLPLDEALNYLNE